MNATTPIRTDRMDEFPPELAEWIATVNTDRNGWGPKMDAVLDATLRAMANSATEYTLADLYEVFADHERREAFLDAEMTGDASQDWIQPYLSIEDDALFDALTRRVRRHVDQVSPAE